MLGSAGKDTHWESMLFWSGLMYWKSFSGEPPVNNKSTISVRIEKSNYVDADVLLKLLEEMPRRKDLL